MVVAPYLNQLYLPNLQFHNAVSAGMKAMPPYPKWNVTGYPANKFHNDTGDSGECPGTPGCPGYIAPATKGDKFKKILNTLSDTFEILGNVTDSLLQGNVTNPAATIPAATKQKGILGMQPVAGALVVVLIVGTIGGLGYALWKKNQPAKS